MAFWIAEGIERSFSWKARASARSASSSSCDCVPALRRAYMASRVFRSSSSTSENRMRRSWPRVTVSPSVSCAAPSSFLPLTYVPLVEPLSDKRYIPPAMVHTAWRRETPPSSKMATQSSPRPKVTIIGSSARMTRPAWLPESTTNTPFRFFPPSDGPATTRVATGWLR